MIPLSVLDLSPISEGSSAAAALRNTLDLARRAEEWGYSRYWVAEQHFAAVASSSPATLVALITAATNTIRVGSAAVQIGHHTAASVVESFATVDAVYPGRVDLGIGRSGHRGSLPMPAPHVAASHAAVQFPGGTPPPFTDVLDDVQALLKGTYSHDGVPLQATPGTGADIDVWLFGSSGGESARVAGERGLPFVANYHVSPGTVMDAVEAYRAAFEPSERLSAPYVVVSADAVVAEDDDTARALAAGFGRWVHSIRSGHGACPYPAESVPLTDDELTLVADRVDTQFVGASDTVAGQLDTLARTTGADELVVTGTTHDHEDRVRSYQLLAKEWGLPALRVW